MNLPVRILHKDLRRYWPLALLAAAFIVIKTLGPLWGLTFSPFGSNSDWDNLFNAFGEWPVIFILVVAVMQEDLTVGDKAFWRTRPIAPRALLTGKLLFFALVLALPALLANLRLATAMDTPWRVSLGIGIETTGFMLLAALFSALLAAITGSLLQAGMAALGVMLVVMVAASVPGALFPQLHLTLPWSPDIRYPGSRIAMACLYAGITLAALLAHQFFTRRTVRTIALLAITAPAALLLAGQWSVDFITPPQAQVFPAAPLTRTESVVVAVEPPARIINSVRVWDATTNGHHLERVVQLSVNLRGTPPGRLIELASATSVLRLADGREMAFGRADTGGWLRNRVQQQEAAICQALDLEVAPSRDLEGEKGIFSLPDNMLATLGGKHGQLTIKFILGERAFHEVLRLPAHAGATWSHRGEMWRLDKIIPSERNGTLLLQVVLRHLQATSLLAPYGDAHPDQVGEIIPAISQGFVLLNRKRGEYVMSPGDWKVAEGGIVAMRRYYLKFAEPRHAGLPIVGTQINDAWLADAEFVILASEGVGTMQRVVVLDDFVVPTPSSQTEPVFY